MKDNHHPSFRRKIRQINRVKAPTDAEWESELTVRDRRAHQQRWAKWQAMHRARTERLCGQKGREIG